MPVSETKYKCRPLSVFYPIDGPLGRSFSGFTLLEILIAIFLFGVIVSVLFGAYTGTFQNLAVVHRSAVSYETAKNCLERMRMDLASIRVAMSPLYKPPGIDDPPDRLRVVLDGIETEKGTYPRLRFASAAHVDLEGGDRRGIAQIVYYVGLEFGNPSQYVLRRQDGLDLEMPPEPRAGDPILCDRIRNVSILCYDEEGAAHETWDSDTEAYGYATPKMVGIILRLESDDQTDAAPFLFETRVALPLYRKPMDA